MKSFFAWAGLVIVFFSLWGAYDAVFNPETGRLTNDEWTELTTKTIGYQPGWKSPYNGLPWRPFSNLHDFESKTWAVFDTTVACVQNTFSIADIPGDAWQEAYDNCSKDLSLTLPAVEFGAGLYIDLAGRETACDQSLFQLDGNQVDIQDELGGLLSQWADDSTFREITDYQKGNMLQLFQERPALWANVVRDCKP